MTGMTVSTAIVALFLTEPGTSLTDQSNRRSEVRTHLMRNNRSECGSIIGPQVARVVAEESSVTTWCYSCLGNALEHIERKTA